MDKNLESFLKNHRISVVGVLQNNGIVHSATMHFAFNLEKNKFYFVTGRKTKKCESLLSKDEVNASLVIGFNEEDPATFQAEGVLSILKNEERDYGWDVYSAKFPNRAKGKEDENVVILQFTPHWGRFSDFRSGFPVETLLSESK